MKSKSFFSMLAVVFFLSFGCPVLAQEEEKAIPNIAQVYFFNASESLQFEAALRVHKDWRIENNDPWDWYVFQVITGERSGDYIVHSQNITWQDMDEYAEFSSKAFANFQVNVGPLVDSYERVIHQVDKEKIRWPEDIADYNLFEVVTYFIKTDKISDFSEAVNKFHQAITQLDWPAYYRFEWLRNGGFGPKVHLVSPRKSWTEFAAPEKPLVQVLAEAYSQEEAKAILQKFAGSFHKTESMVLVFRGDLSIIRKE